MVARDLIEEDLIIAPVVVGSYGDGQVSYAIPALYVFDDRDLCDLGEPVCEAACRSRPIRAADCGTERREGGGEVQVVKTGERCVGARGVVRGGFRPGSVPASVAVLDSVRLPVPVRDPAG